MKTLKNILIISLFLALGCKSSTSEDTEETYNGIIERAGMTTYQYGTHTLKTDHETYALKSETVDLDAHIGKQTILIAKKVPGYPLDGGPVYLEVMRIRE
tara:strand:+ start:174 stop:473 length:300 start_codon:yes stop_codon:yes gene_type:complete